MLSQPLTTSTYCYGPPRLTLGWLRAEHWGQKAELWIGYQLTDSRSNLHRPQERRKTGATQSYLSVAPMFRIAPGDTYDVRWFAHFDLKLASTRVTLPRSPASRRWAGRGVAMTYKYRNPQNRMRVPVLVSHGDTLRPAHRRDMQSTRECHPRRIRASNRNGQTTWPLIGRRGLCGT